MDREKRIRRLISMKKYFLEAGLGMIAVFVIDIAIDYIASGLRGETFSSHFMTLILLMGVVFIVLHFVCRIMLSKVLEAQR